jgi:soluble lytic murein transglycosylase-like protein
MRFCLELVLRTVVCALIAGAVLMAETAPRVVSIVRANKKTGRLVRSIVVTPKPAPVPAAGTEPPATPAAEDGVRALVHETAKNLDVSPLLVESVIQVESNYNPYAISPKGAQGLMQLMPATARRFGVKDSFDAKQNIEGGVKYLKFLQDTFKDDRLALAAYNAGERAVTKYGDVPPYPETMKYVEKVGKKYGQAKTASEKTAAEKSALLVKLAEKPKPADNEPRHITGYMDQEGRLHIETR